MALGQVESPVADQAAPALIEGARRRQRHRRRWVAGGVAVALVATLAAFMGGGRSAKPPTVGSSSLPARSGATISRTAAAPTGVPVTLVFGIGTLGGSSAWAMNGPAFFVTNNEGSTWSDAAPEVLLDQDVGDRAESVAGYGEQDLWLGASDVIGIVPFGQSLNGSDRGTEIFRSTDDGLTWQTSFLPGCIQLCGGNPDVDFLNAQDGFVALGGSGSPSEAGHLFSTTDGGATWSAVSHFASSQFSVSFTTTTDGWGVDGATAVGGQAAGTLYRTTDGGVNWTVVSGLPPKGTYDLPSFFNSEDGVVFGLTPTPTVFVTTDSGTSWAAHLVPVSGSAAQLAPPPWFSAPSSTGWFISWGRKLVETTDEGRHWTIVNEAKAWSYEPFPRNPKGGAWGLVFFSPDTGWAIVGEDCSNSTIGCKSEGIMATSDGGVRWHYVNP